MAQNNPTSNPKAPTCPNCYGTLGSRPVKTTTGTLVCDAGCARGWENGERHLAYLGVVAKLKALIAA